MTDDSIEALIETLQHIAFRAEASPIHVQEFRMMRAEGVADVLYSAAFALRLLEDRSEDLEALICEIAADINEAAPSCGMYENIHAKLQAILSEEDKMTKNLDDRVMMRAADKAAHAALRIQKILQDGGRFLGLEREDGSVLGIFATDGEREAVVLDPIPGLARILHARDENLLKVSISVLSMGDDTAFDDVGNRYEVTGYFGEDTLQIQDPTIDDKIERATHVRLEREGYPGCIWRMDKKEMVARRIGS